MQRDKSPEHGLNLSRSWHRGHSHAYNTLFLFKSSTKDLSLPIFELVNRFGGNFKRKREWELRVKVNDSLQWKHLQRYDVFFLWHHTYNNHTHAILHTHTPTTHTHTPDFQYPIPNLFSMLWSPDFSFNKSKERSYAYACNIGKALKESLISPPNQHGFWLRGVQP